MIDLAERYTGSAKRFLQTAIVIDDQAHFGPTVTAVVPVLANPSSSVLNQPAQDEDKTVAVTVEQAFPDQQGGSLNARVLSQAFMSRDMICGLYRPEPGEAMVDHTAGAARLADIVVVDWFLEPGSSRSAKEIVLQILKSDQTDKGRLRLVAVYTSQPGRANIARELLKEIDSDEELQGTLLQVGPSLVGPTTRVIVLNKRNSLPSNDLDEVTEERLPDRLIEEFSTLSEGLLSSFALSAVAAVRKGAHHVLALYPKELDGAFIAHRAALPNPDDSKPFAVDMLVTELRNLIELEEVAEASLGADVIDAWLEHSASAGHVFRAEHAEVTLDDMKLISRGGADIFKASALRQHVHGEVNNLVPENKRVPISKLSRVFYKDNESTRREVHRLARLTTFQREPGRTKIPVSWRPILSLGTIVEELITDGSDRTPAILLCVQPRCDSVRLLAQTSFPMQAIDSSGEHFNVVLQDGAKKVQEAWVSMKPMDTRMVQFAPDEHLKAVIAELHDGKYVFRDVEGRSWLWLGDLKEMKAQRWAVDLGSRMSGVGMDDLELLRLAGDRKLKRNWKA
jgi:hypothetical protein